MTAQDYHAVIIFLHASDFSTNKIDKEIWTIRKLIDINPRVNKTFISKDWTKVIKVYMKELQDVVWTNRYNIYQEM